METNSIPIDSGKLIKNIKDITQDVVAPDPWEGIDDSGYVGINTKVSSVFRNRISFVTGEENYWRGKSDELLALKWGFFNTTKQLSTAPESIQILRRPPDAIIKIVNDLAQDKNSHFDPDRDVKEASPSGMRIALSRNLEFKDMSTWHKRDRVGHELDALYELVTNNLADDGSYAFELDEIKDPLDKEVRIGQIAALADDIFKRIANDPMSSERTVPLTSIEIAVLTTVLEKTPYGMFATGPDKLGDGFEIFLSKVVNLYKITQMGTVDEILNERSAFMIRLGVFNKALKSIEINPEDQTRGEKIRKFLESDGGKEKLAEAIKNASKETLPIMLKQFTSSPDIVDPNSQN